MYAPHRLRFITRIAPNEDTGGAPWRRRGAVRPSRMHKRATISAGRYARAHSRRGGEHDNGNTCNGRNEIGRFDVFFMIVCVNGASTKRKRASGDAGWIHGSAGASHASRSAATDSAGFATLCVAPAPNGEAYRGYHRIGSASGPASAAGCAHRQPNLPQRVRFSAGATALCGSDRGRGPRACAARPRHGAAPPRNAASWRDTPSQARA